MAKRSSKSPSRRPRLMNATARAQLRFAFGKRLKKFRRQRGLTPSQFYSLSGIDAGNLSKYENGTREPRFSTILIMAKALRISHLVLMDVEFKMVDVG